MFQFITRAFLCAVGCAVLLASSVSFGNTNLPFWTEQAMFRFGQDLYFIGHASCAATSEEGRQRAYDAALREMLNYTRTKEIVGIPIETQMIHEEPNPEGCMSGRVSVWRLLRAPSERLDKLNRIASHQAVESKENSPPPSQVRDLTPKAGMRKSEVFELFGQPKSIYMVRNSSEVQWEYPQFGLTLIFDMDGYLIRWRHVGPVSGGPPKSTASLQQPRSTASETAIERRKAGQAEEEPIDLTKELEKLQKHTKTLEAETDASRYCQRLYSRDPALQDSCTKYEIDKRNRLQSSGDADRAAMVICNNRWPTDDMLRESCKAFEREKILNQQRLR